MFGNPYGGRWNQPNWGGHNVYGGGWNEMPRGFRLISRGPGIDETEFNTIVSSAQRSINSQANQLSVRVANMIKNQIGGEWFVFVCPVGETNYDFGLSVVTGSDFLNFEIGNFHFQVCRLKD